MLCYAMLSHFSRVRLLATPWTAALQAPPSIGFSRQEYWSGVPSVVSSCIQIKDFSYQLWMNFFHSILFQKRQLFVNHQSTFSQNQSLVSIFFIFLHVTRFSSSEFILVYGMKWGNGTPLQYSCLENPMDGGAWWAAVHGVAKSRAQLSEHLHFHFSLSCIGEGNGNPLQCSCLENPRGSGAWWAAVYGIAQSRTRLKRLSSSSSSILKKPTLLRFSLNNHLH